MRERRKTTHSRFLHTNQGCYWSHSSDHQFFATQQTLQSEPCLNLSLVCRCEVAPMASCTVQWSWNANVSFLTMSSLAWTPLQDMNIRNSAKPCALSKRRHEQRHLLPLGVAAKTSEELTHSQFWLWACGWPQDRGLLSLLLQHGVSSSMLQSRQELTSWQVQPIRIFKHCDTMWGLNMPWMVLTTASLLMGKLVAPCLQPHGRPSGHNYRVR